MYQYRGVDVCKFRCGHMCAYVYISVPLTEAGEQVSSTGRCAESSVSKAWLSELAVPVSNVPCGRRSSNAALLARQGSPEPGPASHDPAPSHAVSARPVSAFSSGGSVANHVGVLVCHTRLRLVDL